MTQKCWIVHKDLVVDELIWSKGELILASSHHLIAIDPYKYDKRLFYPSLFPSPSSHPTIVASLSMLSEHHQALHTPSMYRFVVHTPHPRPNLLRPFHSQQSFVASQRFCWVMLLLLNEFDATTLAALLLFDEAMESRTFPPPTAARWWWWCIAFGVLQRCCWCAVLFRSRWHRFLTKIWFWFNIQQNKIVFILFFFEKIV